MYSENRLNDAKLVVKAFVSNQLARVSPALYMKLTQETGRGKEEAAPQDVADYFVACFAEYFERLGVDRADVSGWLAGKQVLEYGPGDVLGVAFLFYAHGAASVDCVDRFPLRVASQKNVEIYRRLLDSLDGERLARGRRAFVVEGDPASGFRPDAIRYLVTASGLCGRTAAYDLILSRAVLEHVDDLDATLADIARALRRDGLSIHQVDLRSHGLDRYQPFDFLTWPDSTYRLMYRHKGFPNRWRVDRYRDVLRRVGLSLLLLEPTGTLSADQVAIIAPKVAQPFRRVTVDELGWLGFWMLVAHRASSAEAAS